MCELCRYSERTLGRFEAAGRIRFFERGTEIIGGWNEERQSNPRIIRSPWLREPFDRRWIRRALERTLQNDIFVEPRNGAQQRIRFQCAFLAEFRKLGRGRKNICRREKKYRVPRVVELSGRLVTIPRPAGLQWSLGDKRSLHSRDRRNPLSKAASPALSFGCSGNFLYFLILYSIFLRFEE